MKKYLILLLVCTVFISCKDDNAELKEGYYNFEITGRYSLDSIDYENYYDNKYMQISKVGNDTYEIYELYAGEIVSPKSLINVYDENKIKGTIYLNPNDTASIEGSINGDKIVGIIKGTYTYYWGPPIGGGSRTVPMNGTFSMEYQREYPQ